MKLARVPAIQKIIEIIENVKISEKSEHHQENHLYIVRLPREREEGSTSACWNKKFSASRSIPVAENSSNMCGPV